MHVSARVLGTDAREGELATPTGLEPATSAVTGRRANQLRYGASMVLRPVSPTGFEPALPP